MKWFVAGIFRDRAVQQQMFADGWNCVPFRDSAYKQRNRIKYYFFQLAVAND